MFSNVLMTALTPLCNTDEKTSWENRPFTSIWPEDLPTSTTRPLNQPKNTELKKTIKKKKRYRTAFSTEQIQVLEKTFYRLKYISAEKRKELADSLNIGERSIKVWFQNRRMKEKRESSESSDSSAEANGSEESAPRPTVPSPQEFGRASSEVELSKPLSNVYPKVEDNHFYSNSDQFSGYCCPNWNSYNNNYQVVLQDSAQTVVPSTKPFVYDRVTYPTSYYPTLSDYYLGESYQYDTGNINSTEIQWSANNFDVHNFLDLYN